jgi:2-oxoacid:acceptor oxidoreductase delta subunit (pyruvate/2-ketoisovalerate family)
MSKEEIMAKALPGYGTINVPKDRVVPFGAVTPAPVGTQPLFQTGNWRVVRPVRDEEKCTRCLQCYMACPDACWVYKAEGETMEWIGDFCKGCQVCIQACPEEGALVAVPELDFEGGVVRLEKPF